MQPQNGQVVAMASYPTYDPSIFVPSITEKDWQALQATSAHSPLTNRADGGLYSPGSTFKLVTAVTGLRTGIVTPVSPYNDTGSIPIQGCTGNACSKSNDSGEVLGTIALPMAITKSSNVYFFNIGQQLWLGRSKYGETPIQNVASEFGFGKLSGLDLPDEKAVPLPSKQRNIELHKKYPKQYPNIDASGNWYTGTNMDLAIGQGELLVTPLQLGNAYAQFANGGDRYRPTLLLRVLEPFAALDKTGAPVDPKDLIAQPKPAKIGHVDLPADWHAAMLEGFSGVTQQDGGTASGVFQGFPMDAFPVAGKTGTAETGVDPATGKAKFSNSFFVGFGPTPKPAYLGVATLEEAGYGAAAAAPVVRSMLEPLANGGTWPTVEPTIPFTPPPATTTTTSTTTTVPGGGVAGDQSGGAPAAARWHDRDDGSRRGHRSVGDDAGDRTTDRVEHDRDDHRRRGANRRAVTVAIATHRPHRQSPSPQAHLAEPRPVVAVATPRLGAHRHRRDHRRDRAAHGVQHLAGCEPALLLRQDGEAAHVPRDRHGGGRHLHRHRLPALPRLGAFHLRRVGGPAGAGALAARVEPQGRAGLVRPRHVPAPAVRARQGRRHHRHLRPGRAVPGRADAVARRGAAGGLRRTHRVGARPG